MLLVWLSVGTALRFTRLSAKPPWTDEFATFVYSLGNSFQNIPLDRAISMSNLLQPLQPNPAAGIGDVIHNLLTEDVHPPLYFVLAHLWMQMFPPEGGLMSLWGARSLPALIGVASISAVYWLSKAAFRSQLVGHLAAAMMAVSPYGIFLAQEARHYTLGIFWVIASLGCLMVAARHIQTGKPLPLWLGLTWVAINTLGISTHYFVILTVFAEALVLIILLSGFWPKGDWSWMARGRMSEVELRTEKEEIETQESEKSLTHSSSSPSTSAALSTRHWWRLVAVAAGTLAGTLVWLPQWQHTYGTPHTEWLHSTSRSFLEWINPVFQSLAAWITMISLLPVEAPSIPVVIASGFVMLRFFLWALPILRSGLKTLWHQSATHLATLVFGGFVLGAIAEFFAISYGLGLDITRGARYNFVYFPGVIALLGAALAVVWAEPEPMNDEPKIHSSFLRTGGQKAVVLILLMGLVSGLTVVCNLGYHKYYRPDLFVPVILQKSHQPVLIATTHKSLVEAGEMMGLAWELKRVGSNLNPQFLLAHQDKDPKTSTVALQQTLTQLPRPLDLWLVNFHAPVEVNNCFADLQSSVNGYEYQHYHCD